MLVRLLGQIESCFLPKEECLLCVFYSKHTNVVQVKVQTLRKQLSKKDMQLNAAAASWKQWTPSWHGSQAEVGVLFTFCSLGGKEQRVSHRRLQSQLMIFATIGRLFLITIADLKGQQA